MAMANIREELYNDVRCHENAECLKRDSNRLKPSIPFFEMTSKLV